MNRVIDKVFRVICPYCDELTSIDNEEEFIYLEEQRLYDTCNHCQKSFVYDVRIEYRFKTSQAPCLNGESHNWRELKGFDKVYKHVFECTVCGERDYYHYDFM